MPPLVISVWHRQKEVIATQNQEVTAKVLTGRVTANTASQFLLHSTVRKWRQKGPNSNQLLRNKKTSLSVGLVRKGWSQ